MGKNTDDLKLLWVNADRDSALHMVFMYAKNSLLREWWKTVEVIIWGKPAKLSVEDPVIIEQIGVLQSVGVKFTACVACAEMFGVTDKLRNLGIEVKPMGQPLTEMIKSDANILTV